MTRASLSGPNHTASWGCTIRGGWNQPWLDAIASRVPAASRADSQPQAILKFHCPSSLDYRARYGLPVCDISFRDHNNSSIVKSSLFCHQICQKSQDIILRIISNLLQKRLLVSWISQGWDKWILKDSQFALSTYLTKQTEEKDK